MDINMATTTSLARGASDSAGLMVLKKAIDSGAQNALALIASLPRPAQSAASLPAHLGQNINTSA